ncbi:hypothetical protein FRB99_008374 [Tulasnella sp. 403]|nr:hypothetical protein FRB99_008374 [Tulasnella sp. 403]
MADATDTSANAKAVKKVKSKHRILAMGKKVVKEVLGGGGNNDSVAQPPKGQTVRSGPPTVITNCSTDAFFEQLLSEIPRSPKRAPIPSPSKRHAPKVSPRKYQEDKTPQPPRKTRNHLAPLQRPGTAEVEKMEALLEKTTTVVGFPTTPSWNSFEFDASVGLSSQGTDSGDEESQAPAESHKERMEKVTHGVGGTTSRTGKRRTRPLPALPELCAPVTSDVRNDRQNTNTNRPPAGDVRTSAAQGTPESHLPQQSAPQGFTPVPPPYDATTQTFQLNPFLASQAASLGFGTSAGQVPQANYPLHLGQAAPAGWNALSQHLLPQAQIPAPPLVGAADHAQVMSSIQAQQQQVRNLELYLALANLSLRIANEGRLPQDL